MSKNTIPQVLTTAEPNMHSLLNEWRPGRLHRWTFLVITGLSGCSQLQPLVGPDYVPPEVTVPRTWTSPPPKTGVGLSTAPTRDLARWWRQLNDPQLNKLVDTALAGNLDLRLAQSRLNQARIGHAQAEAGLLPTLSASMGVNRNKNSPAIQPSPLTTAYDVGFDAGWELDIFGGTQRSIEAAQADADATAAALNNTRVSLVAEVARNYIELRTYQQRLIIARENLTSQTETVKLTQWRYQAGLTTNNDVQQAISNQEQTRAIIPDLEVGLAAAENRLAVLVGQNPGALRAQLTKVEALPVLPPEVGAGIPATILTQRPDIVAAERKLAAETARVGQRLADRFPSLNLGASFGWQAYSLSALGTVNSLAHALSGVLAATLFDGGRLRNAVKIQSAVQEQALLAYQSNVLSALEEVENALIAYAAGRERVAARLAAAEAARNAASLSRNMYQAGLVDFQKVLDTERTKLSAEDGLVVAEAGMRTNLIKLYKALGGGWDRSATPVQPIPVENKAKL